MIALYTAALALVIAVAATSQATAGICDEPPYGADPKRYKLFVDIFNEGATLDFFPNICRAKYKSDEKMRKALVDIGVSSYDIDHDDVTVITLKVLKEFAKVQGRH
jgi:hypothetical protein